jgi:hypothetical protein
VHDYSRHRGDTADDDGDAPMSLVNNVPVQHN